MDSPFPKEVEVYVQKKHAWVLAAKRGLPETPKSRGLSTLAKHIATGVSGVRKLIGRGPPISVIEAAKARIPTVFRLTF